MSLQNTNIKFNLKKYKEISVNVYKLDYTGQQQKDFLRSDDFYVRQIYFWIREYHQFSCASLQSLKMMFFFLI